MSTADGHGRDDEIAATLAGMPVPDHAPDFWDRLDERLAAGDDGEDRSAPIAPTTVARASGGTLPEAGAVDEPPAADVVAIGDAPGRRRRRARLLAAAAAVLVAAAVGGVLNRPADDSQDVDMADPPGGRETRENPREPASTTVPPDSELDVETEDPEEGPGRTPTTPPTTARPPATTAPATTVPAVSVGATPRSAVLAWLDLLGVEGVDGAARLTGPRSQANVARFEDWVKTGAADHLAGWAWVPDRSVILVDLGVAGGRQTSVVVVSGFLEGAHRSAAIPAVRQPDGSWLAEPFAYNLARGGVDLVANVPHDMLLPPDGTVGARMAGNGSFFFSMEGGPVTEVAGQMTDIYKEAVWDPPGVLPVRDVLFVVAYTDGETLAATARYLTVAG